MNILKLIKTKKSKKHDPYDLPLNRGDGGWLLSWVMGLMTYLICITATLIVALSSLTSTWTDGLTGKMTIEIPYEVREATSSDTISQLVERIDAIDGLAANSMSDLETYALIEPWFGGGQAVIEEMPLPLLINIKVENKKGSPELKQSVSEILSSTLASARLDTHQDWLDTVRSLSDTLKLIAYGLALIILFTAIAVVIGASKTNLALHNDKINILHIIGASDRYIARQFQKQTFRLSLEGCAVGFLFLIITLWSLKAALTHLNHEIFNTISLGWSGWVMLALIPYIMAAVAMYTSRITVTLSLKKLT